MDESIVLLENLLLWRVFLELIPDYDMLFENFLDKIFWINFFLCSFSHYDLSTSPNSSIIVHNRFSRLFFVNKCCTSSRRLSCTQIKLMLEFRVILHSSDPLVSIFFAKPTLACLCSSERMNFFLFLQLWNPSSSRIF